MSDRLSSDNFNDRLAASLAAHKARVAASESNVEARHPEGVEMTLDEVTKDMSPEDAAQFKENKEKHEDKFKADKKADDELLRRLLAEEESDDEDDEEEESDDESESDDDDDDDESDDDDDDDDDDEKEAKKKALLLSKNAAGHLVYEDYVRDWKILQKKYPNLKDTILPQDRWEKLMGRPSKKAAEAMLPSERVRLTWERAAAAPSGLYGSTKQIQADCEMAIRRIQKEASRLAASGHKRDPKLAEFLTTHSKRTSSTSAKILLAALKGIGPKLAASSHNERVILKLLDRWHGKIEFVDPLDQGLDHKEIEQAVSALERKGLVQTEGNLIKRVASDKTAAGSGASNAKYLDSLPAQKKAKILKHVAAHYGVSVPEIEKELTDRDAEDLFEYTATDRAMTMEIYRDFKSMRLASGEEVEEVEEVEACGDKTAAAPEYGLYGFKRKTATMGLSMCSEIRDLSGRVAYNLHSRRAAEHARITAFFTEHSKQAKCSHARILLSSYPDPTVQGRTASAPETVDDWLAWDES